MEQRRSDTWIVVGAVFGLLTLPALIVTVVLIGASRPDDGSGMRTAVAGDLPASAPALADDQFAALEASGDIRTMVEQHQAMMDQMRVSASPQMLQLMNSDPMWQMLRSGDYVRLLEQHDENINRMLARGG